MFQHDKLLSMHPIRLPGAGARFVQHHAGGRVRLVDSITWRGDWIGHALRIDAVAPRPRSESVVAVGAFLPASADDLAVAVLDAADSPAPAIRTTVRGVMRNIHPIACSHTHGMLYVLGLGMRSDLVLVAFDADLEHRWTCTSAGMRHLVTDKNDQHAGIVVQTRRGPVVVSLDQDPPNWPDDPVPFRGVGDVALDRAVRTAVSASLAAPSAEERFRALDIPEVWNAEEMQSLAHLAAAAMAWHEGPWPQRPHACSAYYVRHVQNQETPELSDVPGHRSPEELASLKDLVEVWLDRTFVAEMDFLRVGPEDPKWPSTRDL